MKRALVLLALWLADGINYGQSNLIPPLPSNAPHKAKVKPISLVMKPLTTTIVQPPGTWLSWDSPTGACIVIWGCMDLSSNIWYVKTNITVSATNAYVQKSPGVQSELYRASTALLTTDGVYLVQLLNTFTNHP